MDNNINSHPDGAAKGKVVWQRVCKELPPIAAGLGLMGYISPAEALHESNAAFTALIYAVLAVAVYMGTKTVIQKAEKLPIAAITLQIVIFLFGLYGCVLYKTGQRLDSNSVEANAQRAEEGINRLVAQSIRRIEDGIAEQQKELAQQDQRKLPLQVDNQTKMLDTFFSDKTLYQIFKFQNVTNPIDSDIFAAVLKTEMCQPPAVMVFKRGFKKVVTYLNPDDSVYLRLEVNKSVCDHL